MSAHTPGPWKLGDENDACCSVSTGRSAIWLDRMDELGRKPNVIPREEMLANAHLIMAAPDLLEVLREALKDGSAAPSPIVGGRSLVLLDVAKARAAIAKAEGKS